MKRGTSNIVGVTQPELDDLIQPGNLLWSLSPCVPCGVPGLVSGFCDARSSYL